MKRIGLVGGILLSAKLLDRLMINEAVKRRLGGLHSAELVLYSVDFAEIEKCQAEGDWERSGEILGEAAAALERAGAEMILICTNTMHKVAPQIQANIQVPLVHIAEATADELNRRGICRAALLGTKYTMTQDFYKAKLVEAGIEVLVPDEADMETVNDVIYQELCLGEIRAESKEKFLAIIRRLESQGAEGVILGCTEIGLLVKQEDVELPVFDTTLIHGEKAVEMALE